MALLRPDQRPAVLFRLRYSIWYGFGTLRRERSSIPFNKKGDLTAEDPSLSLTSATADDHLSWNPSPTPYTSYFSSWRKVMPWRQWLSDRGATDIVIMAIDSPRVSYILSAEAIAVALGYRDTGFDNRRKLRNHRGEYLVYGGISGDDYAILSVISGGGSEESVDVGNGAIGLPSGFLAGLTMSVENELETEIYRKTGVWGSLKRDRLIRAMCT